MSERHREDDDEVAEVGTVSAENHFTLCPDWILEHPEIGDRALRVWLILMSYARAKDVKVAWLGRRKLAELCKCSVDTIDRAIRQLQAAGAMRVTARHREDDNGQTSNDYTLFTWPHGYGPPAVRTLTGAAPVRLPLSRGRGGARRVSAAPRGKALDGEHLSTPLRSAAGKDTQRPTALSSRWQPDTSHATYAVSLGLSLAELVDDFRLTVAAQEQRSNWGSVFTSFITDVHEGKRGQHRR